MPISIAFRIGGMPWRMVISIGVAMEIVTPASAAAFQAASGMAVMWMKWLSGPSAPELILSSNASGMPKWPSMCAAIGTSSSRPIRHGRS
jgi:hypothetical protein